MVALAKETSVNILVTGAAGFIGKHLARFLAKGHNVAGLYHDSVSRTWEEWKPIQGNILNYPRMLEIVVNYEIEQVYHLASRAIVRNCRLDPLGCFAVNVQGTANVLEACRQAENVKGVMCMESDKSYGSGPTPYQEDQALRPTGVYEASKACVSHLVRAYHGNYGLNVFSVRAANVYGPDDPNESRLIPRTIKRLLVGLKPQITEGANTFLREFIYVDDFIQYITTLMAAEPWGEAVNVGTGETSTITGIVRLICDVMQKPFSQEKWGRPKTFTEIEKQSLDLNLMRSLLWDNDPPHTTLPDGLKKTVEWYQNHA